MLDARDRAKSLYWIIGIGVLCRVVLLPSTPILEIDLYRYLWDGQLMNETGDPYKFAPIEFVQWQYPPESQLQFARSDDDREWIETFVSDRDDSMQENLAIIANHFGQFTTPYPPVSQIVFAASDACCPNGTSLGTRITVLKSFLVLFDIATGLVLVLILRSVGMQSTWSVVWFWSPLVMKEFANGGHLDSIAIFFCSLFLLFCVRQVSGNKDGFRYSILAGICLALGVSAKIFPFVLVPFWAVATVRQFGLRAIAPGLVSLAVALATMYPMLVKVSEFRSDSGQGLPKPGILAFAESWEMNDLIFMVIVENLKPPAANEAGESTSPWFVIVPDSWRDGTSFQIAFDRTRLVTLAIFVCVITFLTVSWIRTNEKDQPLAFVRVSFLTLAWFWLLSPTQNPWYWCWAMPFVCFAKQRSWMLVSVLTVLYYVRFEFRHHSPDNADFDISDFDFVFPFYQFVPVLCLLICECIFPILSDAKTIEEEPQKIK